MRNLKEESIAFLQKKYPTVQLNIDNSIRQIFVCKAMSGYHGLVLSFSDKYDLIPLVDEGYCAYLINDLDELMDSVNDYMKPIDKHIQFNDMTVHNVNKEVSKVFGVNPFSLKREGRMRNVVQARYLAMYIIRQKFYLGRSIVSLDKIGEKYNRNHSSVTHALKTINDLLTHNRPFRELTSQVLNKHGIYQ